MTGVKYILIVLSFVIIAISNAIVPAFSSLPKAERTILFDFPYDVSIDSNGFVYVADYLNNRIQKLTADGKYVTEWGKKGDGHGNFDGPLGVAVDRNGYVFVVDGNNLIQKFTNTGTFIKSWNIVQPDSESAEYSPSHIAVDSHGFLYVTVSLVQTVIHPNKVTTELKDGRIQKYTIGGGYVATWTPPEKAQDTYQSFLPGGIDIGRFCIFPQVCHNDSVFITDQGHNRVHIFSSNPALLTGWGSGGDGKGQFSQPADIAVLGSNVLVLDTYNNRIQVLSNRGNFVTEWGKEGTKAGEFKEPMGLTATSNGFVFVADSGNDRIQVFSLRDEESCRQGMIQIKPGICFVSQWGYTPN